jgi:Tfp pilus assembly PilM family ATPase
MKINLQKIKNILAPQEEIGAIEINNRVVKGFYFSNSENLKIKSSAILPLPNSTINNGYVQNEAALIKTLTELHKALNKNHKVSPYIILSLPAQNFYTSVLSIPKLSDSSNLEEAIKLNLRLRSPIPLESAYLDWENIEDNSLVNAQMVFAAIGDKINIDKYLVCLAKAGFKVLAVEKPALGILRFIKYFSVPENYYLVANIDRDGIDLIVSRNNSLIFYDFNNLSEVAKYDLDNNLSNADFNIFLNKKVGQVVNFCQARQNECLKKFFLFSIIPEIKNELIQSLSVNFSLEPLALMNNDLIKISEEWYSVMGTAIRGTIPRNQDKIVSLMQTGTEKDYVQTQAIHYISLWTKISFTIFASLVLICYGLFTMFFNPVEISQIEGNKLVTSDHKVLKDKVKILETKADSYNSESTKILAIINKKTSWETKMDFVFSLAKKNQINIIKIFISNESRTVTLQGSSPSQNQISNFKDDLEGTKNFTNITSPLESISSDGDNYYFSIKFNL